MKIPKSVLGKLVNADTLQALGQFSGTGEGDIQNVLATALPALLQGVENNAADAATAPGLEQALSDHAKDDTSDITSFLKNVDKEDSTKILAHLLGGDAAKVEKKAAKDTGLSNAQTAAILTACAPLLLSLLGQHGQSNAQGGGLLQALFGAPDNDDADNDGIGGELLGALLGGSSNNSGLGGALLGSLLGGSSHSGNSNSNSGLGGAILDSLLGGDDDTSQHENDSSNDLGGALLGSLLGGSSGGSGLGGELLGALLGEEEKKPASGKKPSSGKKPASGKKPSSAKKKTSKKKTGSKTEGKKTGKRTGGKKSAKADAAGEVMDILGKLLN